jgi:cephalosporin-C deacetylase-like acetyl esterase
LGDLPQRTSSVSAQKIFEEERDSYILEKLALDLNGIESVPAYFVKPRELKGKLPVILFNHSHGGFYDMGKNELINPHSTYLYSPCYAQQLTQMGYGALCIDTWAFGERRGRTESEIFKEMLWTGRVMWGMMVYDSLRAVDYLVSRPDVDSSRIGTLGLSMGSTMAWWVAALDERIKVCIDICCLTDFDSLIASKGLEGHGVYYYVPRLLKHFSTGEINALIAPRAHLAQAGLRDALTPVAGLDRVERELQQVYKQQNAAERWKLSRYDVAHQETPEMRAETLAWLKRWL